MKVGAEKDWTLDLYAATAPSGEAGIHLRFTREGQKFVIFLGRAEQAELARLLHWQKETRNKG
jgi:hypothetical protein